MSPALEPANQFITLRPSGHHRQWHRPGHVLAHRSPPHQDDSRDHAGRLALTMIAVSLMTPRYVATSTLLIEPEAPQLLDVKQLIDGSGSTEDHDYYKTQFELLQSRDLAGRVVSELDLEHNQAFNSVSITDRAINFVLAPFTRLFSSKPAPVSASGGEDFARFDTVSHYLDGLKVAPVAGTRLVTVSYSAPDRALAEAIVDRHVRDYVRMGIELRAQGGKSAREFLGDQLVQISKRVQDSEAALNAYRHKMGIVSFGVDEKNGVAAQRMTDLTGANRRRNEAHDRAGANEAGRGR